MLFSKANFSILIERPTAVNQAHSYNIVIAMNRKYDGFLISVKLNL